MILDWAYVTNLKGNRDKKIQPSSLIGFFRKIGFFRPLVSITPRFICAISAFQAKAVFVF